MNSDYTVSGKTVKMTVPAASPAGFEIEIEMEMKARGAVSWQDRWSESLQL